ncbi:MAG: hypothetical protein ACI87E_002384 [Mariniblastus sp.]|jgi:hypothetical protein
MHETRPAKITSPIVSLNAGYLRTIPVALIIGAIGIGVAFFLSRGQDDPLRRFLHVYLVSFCFVLSISVGCLFFVTIMHLTRAGWSATVRRIAELYAMCAFPLFILFLPILATVIMNMDTVYTWNVGGWSIHDHDAAGKAAKATAAAAELSDRPPIEQLKAAFLNKWFFTGRIIAYFLIWGGMAWFFLKNSLAQDKTGDKSLTAKMQAYSAPFMILFAVTVVFASFDLEMSLSALWFSTMFPVYFFAGAFLSALCTIMLTGLWLQRTGRITDEITIEHYHDLGKLMQGFIIFWGYIAFSQFLLIWYANIPEETFWYDLRINQPGWKSLSMILLVGHLFVPFFLLMGRTLRRNRLMLTISAVFILMMHWVDHYWLIMPQMNPQGPYTLTGSGILMDISCTIGMIAVYIALFCLITRNRPLVALQDPRLGEALNHEVH